MKFRIGLLALGMAVCLGGCADFNLAGDDSDSPPPANGCSAQGGCPEAAQFCVARGYHPDTDAFHRCLVSVEQNLRKGQ